MHGRRPLAVLAAAALGLSLQAGPAGAAVAPSKAPDPRGVVSAGVVGADISWPNCPVGLGVPGRRTLGLPLPRKDAQFVVIGLTNGRAFTRNPCLSTHVAVAKARHLRASAYTMLSYPNRSERRKYGAAGPYSTKKAASRVANVGYAQASAALDAMAAAGLASPFVWIDVEPRVERRWSKSSKRNRALVKGALRAARDRGIGSGIYTYAAAWRSITKGYRVNVPLWAPGHSHARSYAKRMSQTKASCKRAGFTGGPLVMTQWVWRDRDHNITCPKIADVTQPMWVDYRS